MQLLSDRARLLNIFKKVRDLRKDLLFVFHSYFVVTISATNSTLLPVIVELEQTDMTLLEKMIATHFGGVTNVQVYYHNKETNTRTSVTGAASLYGALTDSGRVFFEVSESKTIPPIQTISKPIFGERDAKSTKNSGLFISYNWSTKVYVNAVVERLQAINPNLSVWIDDKNMESDIYDSMGSGISSCQVVVACFSLGYLESVNCMLELEFAQDLRKPIVPIFFFEEKEDISILRQKYSKAFLIIAGKLYSDFKRLNELDSKWETAFNVFFNQLEYALNKVTPSAVTARNSLDIWLVPVSFDADLKTFALEYAPKTREWIIPYLEAWTNTEERVMYLNGGAGTGKSLIVFSLTKNLPSNFVIGAMFFCHYNNAQKSDPIVLVCTIVSKLCQTLGGVFEEHTTKKLSKFWWLMGWQNFLLQSLLIIIDALDELNKDTRHSVLKILTTLCPKLPDFVKIITTGRPERDIYFALQVVSPFVLSPNNVENKTDLEVFVKYRFKTLWGESEGSLEAEKCCKELVEKADGLFIYARNVCEYIKKQNLDPKQALDDIQALTSGSDGVYRAIIERELQTNRTEKLAWFKRVFAVMFTAQRPLTLPSLANVGGLDLIEVETVVAEVRSILKIEARGVISAIHKSVKDFFTDCSRCGPELFIQDVDSYLAVRCLQILNSNLSRNMANLDPRKFYSKEELMQLDPLNEDVQYAVQFWPYHFSLGFPKASAERQKEIILLLYNFCTKALIFYLEALLLLSNLNSVFSMVQSVSDVLSEYNHFEEVRTVLSLLNDLKYVAINFRSKLSGSPLQVYNHALIGVPQETIYYQLYNHFASARISIGAEKVWGPFTLVSDSIPHSVAFSSDSRTVVSGNGASIKIWVVESGECIQTFDGHYWDVNSVAFSPDSKTVVSGSGDKQIKLWSVEKGGCVKTFDWREAHSKAVNSVAFSPDSKTVVSGSRDKTVKLWSVETGKCVKTLEGHFEVVTSVAFSVDSKTVVSGSNDKSVKLWSVETARCVKTLEGHFEAVKSVAFSADSKTVVSGSNDKSVKLWSVEKGECVRTLEGHSSLVTSVAFSLDSRTVVSGSWDTTVKLWSVEIGVKPKTLKYSGNLISVAFSLDSKTVVTGSQDKTVKLWSVETGECVKTLIGHSSKVDSVAFSPDSKKVVSGAETVKLWSVETGECVKTLEGHSGHVTSVAFSLDSRTVASGSWDKTVKLWSVETGECIKTLEGHSGRVTSVAFSLDSETLASGSWDKTVKLWSVETGECVKTFEENKYLGPGEEAGEVYSVAFGPDAKSVISGSNARG
ncbi:hypothetical protein HDU79_011982, partial [Rhizoclosmatium sp. JEL0117]